MLFLDTSTVVAYRNMEDVHHTEAKEIFDSLAEGEFGQGLISEYILLETVTVLKRKGNAKIAIETGETLLTAREIRMVPSGEFFDESWKEFKRREKTGMSFVDASNLVVMRRYGIHRIATFDGEFKKVEGIEVLP
ncbi:MAG: type II toxin-antitoxin system VapC family toxin [Thermoplasmata archaeon]